MKIEQIHTLILGAGPAGLAAGYTLAKAGQKPLLLERDKVCGGLMRSIQRGDFILDIGRKELYNRLSKVDTFWREMLGDDFRLYPHRGGLLYNGHIIDLSPAYRGFRRGMPWGMFLKCGADFLWSRARPKGSPARTVEEFFYEKRGRELTRIVSQGFQEKLTGRRWADIPLAPESAGSSDPGFVRTVKDLIARTFSKKEPNTYKGIWRHPARGTGQICQYMEQGILQHGGQIQNNVKLIDMQYDGSVIHTITAEIASETIAFKPAHVISSIPLEFLVQLLPQDGSASAETREKSSPFRRKTIVLVYLFVDEEPRFPHAWLNVTCPKTRIGRITNYSGLNGDMVPKGKTCLCCEHYCFDEDPMLQMDNKQFVELTIQECAKFELLDPVKCFDNLVLRLPGADASQNRHNWLSNIRLGLLEKLRPYRNLYYVNRTDLDIATLAGIESAEAVMAGDRAIFNRHIDPRQIGIRSEPKAFEFKIPAAQEE